MMTKEEKDALSAHYRGKDLYDPAKDPAQNPHDYQPPAMCNGGEMEGYAAGGMVPDLGNLWDTGGPAGFEPPKISSVPVPESPVSQAVPKPLAPPIQRPASRPQPAKEQQIPESNPASAPNDLMARDRLSQDQFDELLKTLQPGLGQRLGQGAMSGLAGFADAIQTGVAGGPPLDYQKQMENRNQNYKKNLIETLRNKYEVGYKGQELALNEGRLAEDRRAHDLEAASRMDTNRLMRNKEERDAAQDASKSRLDAAETAAKLPATGLLHPSTWGRGKLIEDVRKQLLDKANGANPVYSSPQAQAIKQAYQEGKISKEKANQLLNGLK